LVVVVAGLLVRLVLGPVLTALPSPLTAGGSLRLVSRVLAFVLEVEVAGLPKLADPLVDGLAASWSDLVTTGFGGSAATLGSDWGPITTTLASRTPTASGAHGRGRRRCGDNGRTCDNMRPPYRVPTLARVAPRSETI
jgi:hypothetical protein